MPPWNFSPDGRQLVCSADSEARLWDLTTGREQRWRLPPGLCDCAAFDAGGKSLFLFRAEWELTPAGGSPVGRIADFFLDHTRRRTCGKTALLTTAWLTQPFPATAPTSSKPAVAGPKAPNTRLNSSTGRPEKSFGLSLT